MGFSWKQATGTRCTIENAVMCENSGSKRDNKDIEKYFWDLYINVLSYFEKKFSCID